MLLPDLLAVYRERLRDHQQVIEAEVTTAEPLSDDRATQLRQRLATVDRPRRDHDHQGRPGDHRRRWWRAIGSTVYDGSVATQLQTLRQRLVGQL